MSLPNMFDGILDGIKPHLDRFSDHTSEQVERIVGRLDVLTAAVLSGPFDTVDPRWRVKTAVGTSVDNELGVVKIGEDWELQAVACIPAAPPCVVTIRDGGRLIWTRAFANADTHPGQEITIPPGAQLTFDASTQCELYFEFLRRMPKNRVSTNHGGKTSDKVDPGGMPRMDPGTTVAHGPSFPQTHALERE